MDISIWLIVTGLTKLLLYFCVAATMSGGALYWVEFSNVRLMKSMTRYLLVASVLGILFTIVNFFIQVGAITENGLAGMLDSTFISILWESKLGDSVIFKVIGFCLVLIASYLLIPASQRIWRHTLVFSGVLYAASLLVFGYSFGLIGHAAELSIATKVAIAYHMILVFWWMGMLWPLYRSCFVLSNRDLHTLMYRFGKLASYAVSLLIFCGGIVALSLFDSFNALFFSAYGQLFLLKLILISGLLLIAANHKLRLVPALLKKPDAKLTLAKSIRIEMVVGLLVLITTTLLTTFVGPEHT